MPCTACHFTPSAGQGWRFLLSPDPYGVQKHLLREINADSQQHIGWDLKSQPVAAQAERSAPAAAALAGVMRLSTTRLCCADLPVWLA